MIVYFHEIVHGFRQPSVRRPQQFAYELETDDLLRMNDNGTERPYLRFFWTSVKKVDTRIRNYLGNYAAFIL